MLELQRILHVALWSSPAVGGEDRRMRVRLLVCQSAIIISASRTPPAGQDSYLELKTPVV